MTRNLLKVLGAAAATLGLVAGCSSPSSEPSAEASMSTTVAVKNIAFTPSTLEIKPGTKVTWSNEDADVTHTVTSGEPGEEGVPGLSEGEAATTDGTFDGTLDDATPTFAFTFQETGEFTYFCRVHPSMTATIVVR